MTTNKAFLVALCVSTLAGAGTAYADVEVAHWEYRRDPIPARINGNCAWATMLVRVLAPDGTTQASDGSWKLPAGTHARAVIDVDAHSTCWSDGWDPIAELIFTASDGSQPVAINRTLPSVVPCGLSCSPQGKNTQQGGHAEQPFVEGVTIVNARMRVKNNGNPNDANPGWQQFGLGLRFLH